MERLTRTYFASSDCESVPLRDVQEGGVEPEIAQQQDAISVHEALHYALQLNDNNIADVLGIKRDTVPATFGITSWILDCLKEKL